jgi:hypothetical protein
MPVILNVGETDPRCEWMNCVKDRVETALQGFRCPVHSEEPTVTLSALPDGKTDIRVQACCETFKDRIDNCINGVSFA